MKKVWDRVGILFSGACVIHCIGVAFVPLLFPALKTYTDSSWIHIIVGALILMTSPLAFVPGYKKHGLTWIIALAVSGLLFVLSGIILEDMVSEVVSHGITICGSLMLVIAHAKNLQHSHRHHHQCC